MLAYPTHYKFQNLLGLRFGELLVIQFDGVRDRMAFWICVCACGNCITRPSEQLRGKGGLSCGCLRRNSHLSHGHCVDGRLSPEYSSYRGAKARCSNPKNNKWPEYGGRGIKFCFASFEEFLACLGTKPTPRHTIDRYPDNNGNYEHGNVRWATPAEQANNRRARRSLKGES